MSEFEDAMSHVDQDAVAFPHVTDGAPAFWQGRSGRERRGQRVIFAAGQRPLQA